MPWDDMSATFEKGDTIEISEVNSYKRNDIICFHQKDLDSDSLIFNAFRIVGLPGESILMVDGAVYIDDKLYEEPPTVKMPYMVWGEMLDSSYLERFHSQPIKSVPGGSFLVNLSKNEVSAIKNDWRGINVNPMQKLPLFGVKVIGWTEENKWTRYNFGPIKIPSAGDKVVINDSNRKIFNSFSFEEDKKNIVKTDCFFVLGDNRENYRDSRFIGLIPSSAIIGKVINY